MDNIYKLDDMTFEAIGDRILIQEDIFRSGYECANCAGAGSLKCAHCHGTGQSGIVEGARCNQCEGSGKVTCTECGGRGGILVVPEVTQRRPTSGIIISAGPATTTLKVGDSVLYSNFAGYVVDLERAGISITIRILHETEVLAKMTGHLELRTLKGKSEIAVFNK